MTDTIVFIHGLWMNGMEMSLLQHRFRQSGYQTSRFQYKTVRQSPTENASRLAEHINRLSADRLHFICHSLGGLVLRHYLFNHQPGVRGRTVMLGTPNQSSKAAHQLSRFRLTAALLGKSTDQGLLGAVPDWDATHELGIIAGDLRLGMGMIIPGIPKPNDGTVTIEETKLEGMQDHITLPVSHFGMLFAESVFRQSKHFIEHGCFERR